ncbi:MAG: LamG domain-containing protein [Lentimicrobiaceae bacterium]|jgi:hypothetical protein
MKILKYIILGSLAMVFAVACQKGIDPISYVAPGPDTAAPVVKINYPIEGTLIRDDAPKVPIKIQVEASDDIELASIAIQLDGTAITSFSSFKDYRRAVEEYIYDGVSDGEHEMVVTATDLAGKTGSQTVHFQKTTPYHPLYDGEVFYMPFDGDAMELISNTAATKFGSPTYVAGKIKLAYAGATDAYLTFPTTGLLGSEFSLAFWYNINGTPARGGIFAIARPYVDYNDTTRYKGLRIFRENSGTSQNIGVNLGIGKAEVWISPITTVTEANFGTWMHIAISVSGTTANVYINGAVVKTVALAGPIDWTDCAPISIASGMPNFTYWDHLSDLSLYDEMRIFNKAITADEVMQLYSAKK